MTPPVHDDNGSTTLFCTHFCLSNETVHAFCTKITHWNEEKKAALYNFVVSRSFCTISKRSLNLWWTSNHHKLWLISVFFDKNQTFAFVNIRLHIYFTMFRKPIIFRCVHMNCDVLCCVLCGVDDVGLLHWKYLHTDCARIPIHSIEIKFGRKSSVFVVIVSVIVK